MTELIRVIAVVALLCVAAAICTPKGRLPLVLRGLKKTLGTKPSASDGGERVSAGRRVLSFVILLLAIVLALIRF